MIKQSIIIALSVIITLTCSCYTAVKKETNSEQISKNLDQPIIDETMALAIGCPTVQLFKSCSARLHFDSQRGFHIWTVSSYFESEDLPDYIRSRTVQIHAGTGEILSINEGEIPKKSPFDV